MDVQRACHDIFGRVKALGWNVSGLNVSDRLDHMRMQFTFHCPCGRDIIETVVFGCIDALSKVPADYFVRHQVAVINAELKSHIAEEAA